MGMGDEIMATGRARDVFNHTGKRVVIIDSKKNIRQHEIFLNNPYLVDPQNHVEHEEIVGLLDAPGPRPYIEDVKDRKIVFNEKHRAPKGEIWFSAFELEKADRYVQSLPENFVVVEPNVKGTISAENKQWPFERWQRVADELPTVQLGPGKALRNAFQIRERFRIACAILQRASLFVGTDGGLHHAAGALNVPAVVLWGGYSSPKTLGYEDHFNIWDGDDPCGSLDPCNHCRAKMDAISVEAVLHACRRTDSSKAA